MAASLRKASQIRMLKPSLPWICRVLRSRRVRGRASRPGVGEGTSCVGSLPGPTRSPVHGAAALCMPLVIFLRGSHTTASSSLLSLSVQLPLLPVVSHTTTLRGLVRESALSHSGSWVLFPPPGGLWSCGSKWTPRPQIVVTLEPLVTGQTCSRMQEPASHFRMPSLPPLASARRGREPSKVGVELHVVAGLAVRRSSIPGSWRRPERTG